MNDKEKLEDGLPHESATEAGVERMWQLTALLAWCVIWTVVSWMNRPSVSDFWYDFGLCMTGAAAGVIAILYLILPLIVRKMIRESG